MGVDANFAAPAPASALISTGLVNAGFLALLRVYKLLAETEVFPWVKSVLLLVGVLSLVVGALFLRRTNNYKRFLSYSTVENMGIAAIGLGIGGIGVWAAVFHVVCHTLIKSSLFLQIAVVRQGYGNASTASATTSTSTAWGPWDCSRGWLCWWPSRPRRCSSPS